MVGSAKVIGASRLTVKVCAALLEYEPAVVARRFRVSRSAIYAHRRRLELQTGVRLPRLHNIGRPPKPLPRPAVADVTAPA